MKKVLLLLAFVLFLFPLRAQAVIIQAEAYDQGGEGVAFHDTTPENLGNWKQRNDAVDLVDGGDHVRVGHSGNGEWLQYTHVFPKTSNYLVVFYAGTAIDGGADIDLFVDGVKKARVHVPNSGAWTPKTIVKTTIPVEAGKRAIRVKFPNETVDLDKFGVSVAQMAPETVKAQITCEYDETAEVQPEGFNYYVRYDGETWPAKPTATGGKSVVVDVKKSIRFFVIVKAYVEAGEGPASDPVDFIYDETAILSKAKITSIKILFE